MLRSSAAPTQKQMSSPAVLLVEDNPDDVFIMRRMLKKAGFALPLQVVSDGREALDYLAATGAYEGCSAPSIIFLDLKLPYVHGLEVLEWIRQQPHLRDLEVVVLTSSAEERDQKRAFELGVKTYLVKPPKPEVLSQTLRAVLSEVSVQ
jgi:CheY-like chemotaxis protein